MDNPIWILCVNRGTNTNITDGRIYKVLSKDELYCTILNDRNETCEYKLSRFKDIDPKKEDWGIRSASA